MTEKGKERPMRELTDANHNTSTITQDLEKAPYGFAIVRVDLDGEGKPVDFTFIQANEELARLDHISLDKLIGHGFYTIFPNGNRRWLDIFYQSAFEGKSVACDDVSDVAGIYLHIEAYPIGEKGYCAVILCDFKDSVVEKQRELEEREALLAAYEQERDRNALVNRYAKALGIAYPLIIFMDYKNDTYQMVEYDNFLNKTAEKSGNIDELIKVGASTIPDPESAKKFWELYNREAMIESFKKGKTTVNLRHPQYGDDGNIHYMDTYAICTELSEDSILGLSFAKCIDEEYERDKALERAAASAVEAEKANASKTNFLRRMSHDIRTPLNGVLGMLRIMEEYKGNKEKYEECMEKIFNSMDYLMTIVNNVLEISKMESGEIELDYEPFNVKEVLLGTLPMIEANAANNGIKLYGGKDEVNIEHEEVFGSPVHLNRILMNIVSNAIKYNRRGGTVRIYCNELSCDGEKATYEFVSADTGLGMSDEFMKHAFEPFTQEGKETTTTFSGSGLGLSIVKDIVTRMGGTIDLNSKENIGTTIRIVLSFDLDKNHEGARKAEKEQEKADFAGKKILLVEDNEINMEIAQFMLEGMGVLTSGAKNGKEAVDMFAQSEPGTFDMIFMDVMMPVMDGLEATRAIRALDREDAKKIPIIAMTANAFAEDRQACIEAGMNDHLGKPVDTAEIARILRSYI